MVIVNVREAKTRLSQLLAQVEAGEDVVIARNRKPVARLVGCRGRGNRQFGAMAGQITVDNGFLDPLPEEDLAAWEA